jgi:hypothetical protein
MRREVGECCNYIVDLIAIIWIPEHELKSNEESTCNKGRNEGSDVKDIGSKLGVVQIYPSYFVSAMFGCDLRCYIYHIRTPQWMVTFENQGLSKVDALYEYIK